MQFNNRTILKIIELAIAIVCIVLWETNYPLTSKHPLLICGTIGGFTVICGVLLIGHVINSVVEKRLNALFSIIGCILFVACGAMIIDEWHDALDLVYKDQKRNSLAGGSLMIINGAVFLMDTISIFRT